MAKEKYDRAYVEKLTKKLYEARAELVSIANQVGFILKEVGSSPVKLVPMDQKIVDTATLVSARNVRHMNWRKLANFTLTRAQESKEFKEALKTYAKRYNELKQESKDLYDELNGIQERSTEKERELEKKVGEIAHNANEAIDERELLAEIQYDLLREEGKGKLNTLLEDEPVEVEPVIGEGYIHKLNIALDEKDKAEKSRRSALGWNKRYRKENERLRGLLGKK